MKIEFHPYMHVERFGTDAVDGILNGHVVVTTKIDGCFTRMAKVTMSDGSYKTIKSLKVGDEVLSYNFKTDTLEPKKVKNISIKKCYKTDNEADKWVCIYTEPIRRWPNGSGASLKPIYVTKNHGIYVYSHNKIVEKMAGDLVANDVIITPQYYYGNEVKQAILSGFIGDGSPYPSRLNNECLNHGISFAYGEKQREHAKFKAKILGGRYREQTHVDGFIKDSIRCVAHSRLNMYVNNLYKMIYKNNVKHISMDWLNELDNLGIAMWYMDDGSLVHRVGEDTCSLHTQGYNLHENEIFVKFLKSRGYNFHIRHSYSKNKPYLFLGLMQDSSEKFFSDIARYVIPSMQYKLPEKYRNMYKNVELTDPYLGCMYAKIISVDTCTKEDFEKSSFNYRKDVDHFLKYDIEVEDNHNYFVDGILVHNSNFVTWLSNGELKVGSRKRLITPEDDNQGCAKWVYKQDNYKAYLEKHPNHVLYGEFLIKNHIKDYDITAYKKGYVFDIFDVETKKWLPYEEYTKMLEEFNITYIPAIAILDNPSEQDIYNLLDKTTYLHGGKVGEGLVLHSPTFVNKYGRTVWAKVLTGEYMKAKHTKVQKIPNQLEHDIVDKYITEDFVEKEYCKLVNDMGGWKSQYIGRLLGTIWHTFIEEETWNIIKKFHNPVIDFSVLNRLVVARIKEIKHI